MAELIKPTDTLAQGYPKINVAIEQAEQAFTTADNAMDTANSSIAVSNQALANSQSTQEQLNQIVIDGDSSVEAAQARVNADNTITYDTLKKRLDAEHQELSSQLASITNYRNELFINVREYGAKLDGVTDDTLAIQSALDTGKNIFIPSGVGMIDCKRVTIANYADDTVAGLIPKSNQTILFSSGAKLKAIPNDAPLFHAIFGLQDAENVIIINATLEGERSEHLLTTGEWGYGVSIHHCKDVTLINCKAYDWWGDGFIVGPTNHLDRATISTDIKFINCKAYNNRRQGLSVTGCEDLLVQGGEYSTSNGTDPMSGIDLEPNDKITINRRVKIIDVDFKGNQKFGLMLTANEDVLVDRCRFDNNCTYGAIYLSGETNIKLTNCLFENNTVLYYQLKNDSGIRSVDVLFKNCKIKLSDSNFLMFGALGEYNGNIDFIDNEIEYVSTVGKTLQLNGSIDKFSRFIRNKVIIPANFTGDNLVELGILVYAVSNFLVSDNDFINYSTTSLKLFTASTPLYGKPNRINGNITNRYNATKGYLNGDIYNVTVGIGDIPVGETKSSTPGYIKAFGITFKNKVVATPLFDTKGLIITTRIDEVNEGVILDVYNPTTASAYFEGSFNISIE